MSTVINPVVEAARLAAEAIREINHRTISRGAYTYPSDAYATIGELSAVGHRLHQAVAQLAGYLDDERSAGRLVANWGQYEGHTDAAVDTAWQALHKAAHDFKTAACLLDHAHTATAGLAQVEADA